MVWCRCDRRDCARASRSAIMWEGKSWVCWSALGESAVAGTDVEVEFCMAWRRRRRSRARRRRVGADIGGGGTAGAAHAAAGVSCMCWFWCWPVAGVRGACWYACIPAISGSATILGLRPPLLATCNCHGRRSQSAVRFIIELCHVIACKIEATRITDAHGYGAMRRAENIRELTSSLLMRTKAHLEHACIDLTAHRDVVGSQH